MASHRREHISELVQFARSHSPFYASLYSELPENVADLEALPMTDTNAYWEASLKDPGNTMTGPFIDGTVMRSGGSTGSPKIVYLTKSELRTYAQVKSVAMAQGSGLVAGDRIAHLSHQGSLYGSFTLFEAALQALPLPTVNLPIGNSDGIEKMAAWIEEFHATVIQANVSTIRRLAQHITGLNKTLPAVRLLWYTGEPFSNNLRSTYKAAFPNAIVYPSVYGCVETGPVGIPPHPSRGGDDDIAPIYKVLAPILIMEILDEDGHPITKAGERGIVVITHLVKRQQPMLRYPIGDIASWVDYDAETFRLHGRSAVGLKIATTHLPVPFLKAAVDELVGEDVSSRTQFVARRVADSDAQVLVVRIAEDQPSNAEDIRGKLTEKIASVSPTWIANRANGNIAPLQIEWVRMEDLATKTETGKLLIIVEERF